MEFDEQDAAVQSLWGGQTFYFCHPICKKIFDANPSRFVSRKNCMPRKIQKMDFARDDQPAALKEL